MRQMMNKKKMLLIIFWLIFIFVGISSFSTVQSCTEKVVIRSIPDVACKTPTEIIFVDPDENASLIDIVNFYRGVALKKDLEAKQWKIAYECVLEKIEVLRSNK